MQLVDLPIRSRLLAEANDNVWSYFGHDPVHDEYKVLSTVWEDSEGEGIVRSEHQMLVLGPGAYWRNTYSITPPPHRPYSQEFNVIELPAEAGIVWHKDRANLINYGGKLAVLEYSSLSSNASVDLWVLEDSGDMKWSNKNLVLPLSQMNFVHGDKLEIQCMSRCGEIRLLKKNIRSFKTRPSVIYDLVKNKITRRLAITSSMLWFCGTSCRDLHTIFWEDDLESIMFLET
ncbi:F-box associated interaction domain [Arabidopsis thaliana x Arabidopsis arenosa]|uniref:F-box associated interaction domain n=1 Tax=Arabidopsis thaliana x Arabidopsis arenosa TaxID=1240361 RepID=A0A8T1ZPP9_9BRAS|nr:F-box associated interaction domain [Arabidopsis thaliana x Arabidopsis arenosa]